LPDAVVPGPTQVTGVGPGLQACQLGR